MNPGPFHSPLLPDKSEIEHATSAGDSKPKSASTGNLTNSVIQYIEARCLLFGIEMQQALRHGLTAFACLAICVMAIITAWLLLMTSLVGMLAEHFENSWVKATAVVGSVHILIALTAGLVVWRQLVSGRWFAESLNELKRDRLWLKTQTTKN